MPRLIKKPAVKKKQQSDAVQLFIRALIT